MKLLILTVMTLLAVQYSAPQGIDNRPLISPASREILLNLNAGVSEVYLGVNGTGGPLTITDLDSPLQSGFATISVIRNGIRETYPNQYGICGCTDPLCLDVFTLCQTSYTVQLDLFDGATSANPTNGPTLLTNAPPGHTVWSFNGANTMDNNWLSFSSIQQSHFLSLTDNFTISMWLFLSLDSNAQYIIACERDTLRYFNIFDSSTERFIFYYYRDVLDGITNTADDIGYDSLVGLSFYYNPTLFPNGLRDDLWHFISLTVKYPKVTLVVDGYELRPTRGFYRDETNAQVLLNRCGNEEYEMPARILTKNSAIKDDISCKIGGSARATAFSLDGKLRQLTVTDNMTPTDYRCLASCNEYIDIDSSVPITSSFQTFYNPVQKTFQFSSVSATDDSDYTQFLQALIFVSNEFMLVQDQGEIRRVEIRVTDGTGFGNTAFVNIIGHTNQTNPNLDVNGDQKGDIDFTLTIGFVETKRTVKVDSIVTVNANASLGVSQTWLVDHIENVLVICITQDVTARERQDYEMTPTVLTFTNEIRTQQCSVTILPNATQGKTLSLQLILVSDSNTVVNQDTVEITIAVFVSFNKTEIEVSPGETANIGIRLTGTLDQDEPLNMTLKQAESLQGINVLNTTLLLSNQNRSVSAKVEISDMAQNGTLFKLKLTPTVYDNTVQISSDTITLTVYDMSTTLTAGEIAGIIIGIMLGIAVVTQAIIIAILVKRKKSN